MFTQESRACERSVCGSILNGDAQATDCGLRAEAFTDDFCRRVFSIALQLEAQGKRCDLATAADFDDQLDVMALVTLSQEAAPVASLAGQHAENIRTAAMRRRLAALCTSAMQRALDNDVPLEETIAKLRAGADKLSAHAGTGSFTTGVDAMCDLWSYLERDTLPPAISTGLPKLDDLLGGGLRGGKLVVVGARPSVGKSALMSFIGVHAIRAGKKVLFDSLEMSDRENIERMLAQVSGVSVGAMERRTLSEGDWLRLTDGVALLPGEAFRFTTRAQTVPQLRSEALRMRASGGLDLVIVDYLQLMSAGGKTSNRVEAVSEISRGLKLLAVELGVPVLVGAQTNRSSTVGEARAPRLSELRESGSIEQDADVVIMLHDPQTPGREGLRELSVQKHRQGRKGMFDTMFDGGRMRFVQA